MEDYFLDSMEHLSDVDLFGRKTFFIAPDASLIPNSYLEEFMENGFESYIINDDYSCPMRTKVREIISMFPDSILFFNIDSSIEGIEWKSYIRELAESTSADVLFGICHLRRSSESEEARIASDFLKSSALKAGSISLDPKNHDCFEEIKRVLIKNGARGRRNLVRAECSPKSTILLEHHGSKINARLLDVNVTHFLCDLGDNEVTFKIFDKIRDVSLNIEGLSIKSDAVLIMKRRANGVNLCIFMFIKRDDSPDLEKESAHKLNKKIYQLVLEKNSARLRNAFARAEK